MIVGAGIAKVEVIPGTLNVTVTERLGDKGLWWLADDNARYGDISAYRDERSDWIYVLGGAPNTAKDYLTQNYVYQARVNFREAFDLSKYEYWHGRAKGWKSEVLKDFNSETAVMWNSGQGQIVWSEYLQCYIFVHTGKSVALCSMSSLELHQKRTDSLAEPGSNRVMMRTASQPEGPWSEDMIVYCTKVSKTTYEGGQIYAGVAHPYLDPSGKTLTVTYTNHPNTIEAIKVTFR